MTSDDVLTFVTGAQRVVTPRRMENSFAGVTYPSTHLDIHVTCTECAGFEQRTGAVDRLEIALSSDDYAAAYVGYPKPSLPLES